MCSYLPIWFKMAKGSIAVSRGCNEGEYERLTELERDFRGIILIRQNSGQC